MQVIALLARLLSAWGVPLLCSAGTQRCLAVIIFTPVPGVQYSSGHQLHYRSCFLPSSCREYGNQSFQGSLCANMLPDLVLLPSQRKLSRPDLDTCMLLSVDIDYFGKCHISPGHSMVTGHLLTLLSCKIEDHLFLDISVESGSWLCDRRWVLL